MRYAATILVILALKLALLAIFGPISAPDTAGYLEYSDAMLAGSAWLRDAGLAQTSIPATALRMLGYPALITAARLIAGGFWPWLLACCQIALSILVLIRLCALRQPLGLSPGALQFVLAAVGTSASLVLDPALLSDSVNASLVALALIPLVAAAASGRPLGAWTALGSGLLLAAAFLLREALEALWLSLVPLLLLAAGKPRRLAVAACALLPLAATIVGYSAWNKVRTGTAFVTTGAQTALLVPLAGASARDPAIFAGASPLDQVARETLVHRDFAEIRAINDRLFATWHMTAPEIAAAAGRQYFTAWRDHPAAMARMVLADLRENQVFLLFQPVDALRQYLLWARGAPSELGRWKSVAGAPWLLPVYLLSQLCRVVSAALFAGFVLGAPWRAWRDARVSHVARTGLAVWFLYLGWFAIYVIVHVETRYMAPVLPFAILFGTANLAWFRRQRNRVAL